jgi:hypothetical protein
MENEVICQDFTKNYLFIFSSSKIGKNVGKNLSFMNSTRTSMTQTRRVWFLHPVWFQVWLWPSRMWFWHGRVWCRYSRVWFKLERVLFQHAACDFKTNQLKLTSDYQKILIVFWLVAILHARVWFGHTECNFHTKVCEFDMLRVKYVYVNLSCRNMLTEPT